jgi:predicted small secreted protein
MKRRHMCMLLTAAGCFSMTACNKTGVGSGTNQAGAESKTSATEAASSDPIKSAESAAPASIAHLASIVTVDASGAMKTLRQGSNGWTCMPDAPTTPGPDPMCFDANAGKWVEAWVAHKPPPAGTVGMMYMLEGGTDASNGDPYATKPTANNDWVKTGPHIMIVGSKEILAGMPATAKPDTAAPYVMWAGTPYAHLMVPVG